MSKILEKEYFHCGTNAIYKELWLYPQMEQIHKSYIKPYGGLWCSNINDVSLSDWIAYKEDESSIDEIEQLHNMKNCLIKFKNNSKFISIGNRNDYKNLKDSGFVKILDKPIELNKHYYTKIIDEIIDYEKLSEICDLLYVDHTSHSILSNYSVRTMLALKPDCIEYYKPIEVDYEQHKILKTDKKQCLKEPNKHFYLLYNYIENLFYDIHNGNYEDYINNLYTVKNNIIYLLNNDLDDKELNLVNIPLKYKKLLITNIVNNIYKDKYLEKQKILIKN